MSLLQLQFIKILYFMLSLSWTEFDLSPIVIFWPALILDRIDIENNFRTK